MKLRYQMRGLGIGIMVTALLMGVATGKGIPLSDAEIKAKALELGMVERDSIRLTDLANGSPAPEVPSEEGAGAADGSGGVDNAPEPSGSSGNASGINGAGSQEDAPGADSPGASGAGASDNVPDSGIQVGSGVASEPDASSEQGAPAGAGSGNAPSGTGGQDGGDSVSGENAEDGDRPEGGAVTIVIEFGVTSSHVSEMLEEAGLVEDAASFDNYLCSNGYSRSITAGTYEIAPGTSEEDIVKIITKTR